MNRDEGRRSPESRVALQNRQAYRLLELGLAGAETEERRPVDLLLEWLETEEGTKAFEKLDDAFPLAGLRLEKALVDGDATLDAMKELKDRAKRAFNDGSSEERRHLGTLAYFLASAAALVHYRQAISSLGRSEVEPILRALGSVSPPPWAGLFDEARKSF